MSSKFSLPSSFRDPSGFVYQEGDVLYRQVAFSYQSEYDLLMQSGLYRALTEKGQLISHIEMSNPPSEAYKILKPQKVPFISYPYEWSFSQLKDAALLTLRIQKTAMEYGMSLKDASAFNIQFSAGKPILIDTLSFEQYPEGKPWVAYRQFCQHFLAPLALMARCDLRLGTLSALHLDGIPLDLASRLLPRTSKLSIGLAAHLHFHARSQKKHAHAPTTARAYSLSKHQLLALLDNLEQTVRSLSLPKQKTTWDDYYDNTNYTDTAHTEKKRFISEWITQIKPESVWDAGANDATFSRLAASQGIPTIASDIDPVAVEKAYRQVRANKETTLLPLIIDLISPSPAIGWANRERPSFLNRLQVDLTLCLAFIHHLAIANNLPLPFIAELFAAHTTHLIIEFVPKEDSNTKRLLSAREDIFPTYTQDGFEAAFAPYFSVVRKQALSDSTRTLYLMKKTI